MIKRGIWEEVDVEECWDRTGKGPIGVRWVDTNKGSEENPDVRCRLVARDFKSGRKDREDLFAATPPLEMKRLLVAKTASGRKGRRRRKMLFIDAKKAHLNPRCDKEVYVELAAEAGAKAGRCGKLVF